MKEEHTQNTITIDSPKLEGLSLCQMNQPQYQCQEEQKHTGRTEESFLLSYRTEDKVSILLWHELQLSLRSVQKSLTLQTTRSDSNLTLMNIVTCTSQVFIQA